MKVDEHSPERSRFDPGISNRIRNVMELEIEKDLLTKIANPPDDPWAFGREQLFADLEHPGAAPELFDQLDRPLTIFDIERYYSPIYSPASYLFHSVNLLVVTRATQRERQFQ